MINNSKTWLDSRIPRINKELINAINYEFSSDVVDYKKRLKIDYQCINLFELSLFIGDLFIDGFKEIIQNKTFIPPIEKLKIKEIQQEIYNHIIQYLINKNMTIAKKNGIWFLFIF